MRRPPAAGRQRVGVAGAPKLGATANEIGRLLARSGFVGEAADAAAEGSPA